MASCAQVEGVVEKIPATAARVEPQLAAACEAANKLAPVAMLVPYAAAIVPFVTAGCNTADGLAKLASDPSSTAWVNQLIGQMKALTGQK